MCVSKEFCDLCRESQRQLCEVCKKDLLIAINKNQLELKQFIGFAGGATAIIISLLDLILRFKGI